MSKYTYTLYEIGKERGVRDYIKESGQFSRANLNKFLSEISTDKVIDEAIAEIFDFDYGFYNSDEKAKTAFERLFTIFFFDCEIGFETIEYFKVKLEAFLKIQMPFYSMVFDSQIDFEEVKNGLTLETTTETSGNGKTTESGTDTTTTETTANSSASTSGTTVSSDYPQATLNSSIDYASGAGLENSTNKTENTADGKTSFTRGGISATENSQTSTTKTKGNNVDIAELSKKYQEILRNINLEILDKAKKELFLKVW